MNPNPFRALDPVEPPDHWDDVAQRIDDPDLVARAGLGVGPGLTGRAWARGLVAAAAVIVMVMVGVVALGTEPSDDALRTTAASQDDDPAPSTPPQEDSETAVAPTPATTEVATGDRAPATGTEVPTTTPSAPPEPAAEAPVAPTAEAPPVVAPPAAEAPLTAPLVGNRVLNSTCTVHFTGDLPLDLRSGSSPVWSVARDSHGTGPFGMYGVGADGEPYEIPEWAPQIVGHGELLDGSATFEIGIASDVWAGDFLNGIDPRQSEVADLPAGPGGWPGRGYVGRAPATPPTGPRHIVLPPVPSGRAAAIGTTLSTGPHPDGACTHRLVFISVVGAPGASQAAVDAAVVALFGSLRPGPQ